MKKAQIDINELIKRYLDDSASATERQQLMQAIRSGRYEDQIKSILSDSLKKEIGKDSGHELENKIGADRIFKSIVLQNSDPVMTVTSAGEKGAGKTRSFVFLRYAAAFLIIGAVGIFLYTGNETTSIAAKQHHDKVANAVNVVVNNEAVTKKITLSDGSTVSLEPGSELRFATRFENDREVYLTGNAFFEVTKDPAHPFLVYANEVTTKVLGTSFRIRANKNEKEIVVAVKTGKVAVFTKSMKVRHHINNAPEILLTPNQQAVYNRNENVVVKQIVEEPEVIIEKIALKSNYVNEPVVDILHALENSYGIEILFDEKDLSGCTLTSDIIEGEGLYEQLEIVCNALGGQFKIESDASILIEARGCR